MIPVISHPQISGRSADGSAPALGAGSREFESPRPDQISKEDGVVMNYKEAADRIEEHMHMHYGDEYPNAIKITEALQLAVDLLRKFSQKEDGVIQKGTPIWYVDFENGYIERGVVTGVQYKGQKVNVFSVNFDETGDFDEFSGDAIGDCFFLDEEAAKVELAHGIKG